MTQEEKAKRYDEAYKVAEGIHRFSSNLAEIKRMEEIFPELKEESEDERIRKAISKCVEDMCGVFDKLYRVHHKDAISWLEKQGKNNMGISEATKKKLEDNLNKALEKETPESWNEFLKKQDEKKQDPCEHCKDRCLNCHNFPCIEKREFEQGKTALEAIKEEKVDNANKVESKFKDGDVLYSPSHRLIWIYKDNEHYYACVNMNYVTKNIATNGLIVIPNDACPATKDEQTVLFARMKEAGYEWDVDKKELKKIEHNPAWSEEDREMARFIGNAITTDESSDYLKQKNIEVINAHVWLDSLKDRVQPKQEWSEEDEFILKDAITAVDLMLNSKFQESNPNLYTAFEVAKHWLKSLKDRVIPQPKHEWSEENDYMLESIISDFAAGHKSSIGQDKWLKSLKPQNRWKPSDEQMAALNAITVNGCISYTGQGQDLAILYNDLKRLLKE